MSGVGPFPSAHPGAPSAKGRPTAAATGRRPAWAGLALAASVLLVSACAEKRDTAASSRKLDDRAVAGANPAYTAPGWKAGDATSWQEHMRTRAQAQNEYSKTR